ncbi:MAG: hypothetical protein H6759_03625 [Candidatus Nomurabacteria bacterium]|nr:MAG: hypothetical protein H6759_03625 [Candidatus Nomurabacteria bacterium]
MNVEVGTSDICRELAEVKSKDTNSDAAFTDRVWKQSGYRDPATGATYSETNAPFSSALNTGVAGIEPLFQNGGEEAGFTGLKTPTFLRSGLRTYYSNAQFPRDKYAYLSNMFARVYRVYQFHRAQVSLTDKVCLSGPFKGKNCNTGSHNCDVNGRCDPNGLTASDRASNKVCYVGPGAGQSCSNDLECKGFCSKISHD